MKASEPPRVATWLLERLAPRLKRESLLGDLIERYHHGRSAAWYWRHRPRRAFARGDLPHPAGVALDSRRTVFS